MPTPAPLSAPEAVLAPPTLRPYLPSDLQECTRLFQSNLPLYFAHREEELFQNYLTDGPLFPYFVLAQGPRLLACGGVYYSPEEQKAELHWGMVDATQHRQGYGTALLEHRVRYTRALHGPHTEIISRTTPWSPWT